jgi:hypothetical protein
LKRRVDGWFARSKRLETKDKLQGEDHDSFQSHEKEID